MVDSLSPADRRALQKIAQRLSRVEKAQRKAARTAQGAYRSIEGGATEVYDDDGVLRAVVGQQADDTYTHVDLNAPAPPTPAAPSVDGGAGVLTVTSYGLTADLSDWPLDLKRLDVHVGAPGFVHSAGSKVAEFTVDGGAVTLALPAGTYEALLVAVNTSGTESPPSATALGVVTAPTTGAGGVTTYHTAEPPVGLDASADGALWYDTDASNLPHRWDGDTLTWVPMPIGPGATTDDVVAGKRVPLDTELSLEWGVPDPAVVPELAASLVPLDVEAVPSAFGPKGLVDHAGSWVRAVNVYDGAAYRARAAFTDQATGDTTYGPMLLELSSTFGSAALGIARIGTRWYVLGSDGVYVYEDDWAFVTSWAVPGTPIVATLATDGTSVITLTDAGVIQHHDPDTGAVTSTVDISGVGATSISGIAYGSFDLGAPRYALISDDYGSSVTLVDSAGVEQTAEAFACAGVFFPRGIAWDGSRFVVGNNIGQLWATVPDLTTREVWAAYTAYDSDPTGGTHETAPSPISTAAVTLGPRQGLQVIVEALPLLDEVETPDTVRIYTYTGTGPPTEADLHLNDATVRPNDDTYWYVAPANVGAAPPVVSTFIVGPSGQQASEVGGYVVRGDGTGDWPHLVRQILAQVAAAYATADHSHIEYDLGPVIAATDARVDALEVDTAALDTRVDGHDADLAALDTRVDVLEQPKWGEHTETPVGGEMTVTHGLGSVPSCIQLTGHTGPGGPILRVKGSPTATQFRVEVRADDGTQFNSQTSFFWTVYP